MSVYYKLASFFLVLLLLQAVFACKSAQNKSNITNKEPIVVVPEIDSSPIRFEPDPFSSLVELETKFGILKIELFFETPDHRENFLKLANKEYYNDLLFHRVIKGFMMQGGDPSSKNASVNSRLGGGGTGYEIKEEIGTHFFHTKGALAAARQPDEFNPEKKSSGSQFYIVHGSKVSDEQLDRIERQYNIAYSPEQRSLYKRLGGAPQLDMEYTVFGRVYEGFPVLDSIANQMTDNFDRPAENISMKIRVIRD